MRRYSVDPPDDANKVNQVLRLGLGLEKKLFLKFKAHKLTKTFRWRFCAILKAHFLYYLKAQVGEVRDVNRNVNIDNSPVVS